MLLQTSAVAEQVYSHSACQITLLFVDPSQHGRGLGTLLIKHAQASALAALQKLCIASEAILLPAERDKVVVLNLYCFEKNAAGIRVYSRQGFVKKGSVEEPDLKEEASFLQWEHNLTETTA